MGRTKQKRLGTRPYRNYDDTKLQLCLEAVRSGNMTHRQAEEAFKIPRKTIYNKLKQRHAKQPGCPPVFSADEEKSVVWCLTKMAEYGFPVTERDLRWIVGDYLRQLGKEEPKFSNNIPGKDWLEGFKKRNPEVTLRWASNIKRNRAAVSVSDLKDFINHLTLELEGVPPCNIFNFDETCLVDDPGKKKVVVRRGTKYVDKICNTSKCGTSIMFCGSASGELLPPYVLYKSTCMWTTWTEDGPPNTRYNNSPSGWFDAATFLDWFQSLFLPFVRHLDGKKVVICDNLSSHISVKVLKECEKNNISFICLPPNSTHLTQPLDVSVFRGVKAEWRKLLGQWKENIGNITLRKEDFPRLLKKLMENIEENVSKNLISGFRACGIVPCDVEALLKRIPGVIDSQQEQPIFPGDSFLKQLETRRAKWTEKKKGGKRKKMDVPPGKSVTTEDLAPVSASSSQTQSTSSRKAGGKKTLIPVDDYDEDEEEENRDLVITQDDSEDDVDRIVEQLQQEEHEDNAFELLLTDKESIKFAPVEKEVGKFCVIKYMGQMYPGKILSFDEHTAEVSSMHKSLKSWKWPTEPDVLDYPWKNVLGKIQAPKLISKRGFYRVPELDDFIF